MEKKKINKIEWNLDEPGNHPPYHGYFLVFGTRIHKGKAVKDTRIVYCEKGKGFIDNDDMQVDFWAEIPRP